VNTLHPFSPNLIPVALTKKLTASVRSPHFKSKEFLTWIQSSLIGIGMIMLGAIWWQFKLFQKDFREFGQAPARVTAVPASVRYSTIPEILDTQ
jgi:hypothetical protein